MHKFGPRWPSWIFETYQIALGLLGLTLDTITYGI